MEESDRSTPAAWLESVARSLFADRLVAAIVFAGITLRVVFWATLFPIWKHFATFLIFKLPVLSYLGDFEGYKPTRSPFYDLFSAILYVPSSPVLGIRATTLFALTVSCLAVPAMYVVAKRLFDREVAVFATLLYALFPKTLVLTGLGFPEAVSTGVLILALAILVRPAGEIRGSVSGGAVVALAYLLYIPAVLFGLWTGLHLLWRRVAASGLTLAGRFGDVVRYAVVPSIIGVGYLVYGPVRDAVAVSGGEKQGSLFVAAGAYSTGEKLLRYVGYNYFDFWWHLRGFDKEANVLRTVDTLSAFFGNIFPVFVLGWASVTLVLTATVGIGLAVAVRRRRSSDIYVVGIVAVYLFVDTYRNLGWTGGFQMRHVFPFFIGFCLLFGIGATSLRQWAEGLQPVNALVSRLRVVDAHSALLTLKALGLLVLVAVAIVNVGFTAGNNRAAFAEPTDALTDTVGPEESVAVTTASDYRLTVLYSEGRVWPVIFADRTEAERAASATVRAEALRIGPANVSAAGTDYLYIIQSCGAYSDRQQALLNATIRNGGTMVFDRIRERGARCRVRATLVRL